MNSKSDKEDFQRNILKKEIENAEKYVLTVDDQNLVKLTQDNVAKALAYIMSNTRYKRAADENAGKNGKYTGSTAFWFSKLKNNSDSDKFHSIIENLVVALDRDNSTHLNADLVGRAQLFERLRGKYKSLKDLKDALKRGYEVYDLLSKKTKIDNGDKKHRPRENRSFASKFCHYACFYLFDDDKERDRFSIYDDVIKKALPMYLNAYNINESIETYPAYNDAIGKLLDEVKKQKNEVLSRNGFDQLVWYYHR